MKLFCILLAVVLVVVNAKVITHVPYGDELDVYVLTNPINVDSNNEFPMSDLETAPMLALGFHNKMSGQNVTVEYKLIAGSVQQAAFPTVVYDENDKPISLAYSSGGFNTSRYYNDKRKIATIQGNTFDYFMCWAPTFKPGQHLQMWTTSGAQLSPTSNSFADWMTAAINALYDVGASYFDEDIMNYDFNVYCESDPVKVRYSLVPPCLCVMTQSEQSAEFVKYYADNFVYNATMTFEATVSAAIGEDRTFRYCGDSLDCYTCHVPDGGSAAKFETNVLEYPRYVCDVPISCTSRPRRPLELAYVDTPECQDVPGRIPLGHRVLMVAIIAMCVTVLLCAIPGTIFFKTRYQAQLKQKGGYRLHEQSDLIFLNKKKFNKLVTHS